MITIFSETDFHCSECIAKFCPHKYRRTKAVCTRKARAIFQTPENGLPDSQSSIHKIWNSMPPWGKGENCSSQNAIPSDAQRRNINWWPFKVQRQGMLGIFPASEIMSHQICRWIWRRQKCPTTHWRKWRSITTTGENDAEILNNDDFVFFTSSYVAYRFCIVQSLRSTSAHLFCGKSAQVILVVALTS